ncbi:MAG: hypothetical protein PUC05_01450 [Firmicutes bacterium]|nr:hypothetical protein [Bacillota bacterium]
MSNSKKSIMLSALCLAVAVMLLGYSSYGWMTMTRRVRAIGQNVQVTVPENLQISLSADGPWTDSLNVELKDIVKSLTQNDPDKPYNPETDRFYLLPASSYAGFDGTIWQTESARNDGSAAANAVFQQGNRIKWNVERGAFEGHWIDVPLYFKTDSESTVDIALLATATSVAGDDSNIQNTVRAAFLDSDCDNNSAGANDPLVFAAQGNHGVFDGVVIKDAQNKIAPRYMSFENGTSAKLFTLKPGRDGITRIVVRIWVEGQSLDCVAKIGGQTFSLSLGFCIMDDTNHG